MPAPRTEGAERGALAKSRAFGQSVHRDAGRPAFGEHVAGDGQHALRLRTASARGGRASPNGTSGTVMGQK